MDASAWIALMAAAVALATLPFTWWNARSAHRSADAAQKRLDLQRKIHEDSAQPYVWASIVGDDAQGTILQLVVRNEGPSVAKNIKVVFDPPPKPTGEANQALEAVLDRLASGLSSLPPGRRIGWFFDSGPNFFTGDDVSSSEVTVTYDGPLGPCPPNTYVVHLEDIKQSLDIPEGSLHRVAERIKDVAKAVNQSNRPPSGTSRRRV